MILITSLIMLCLTSFIVGYIMGSDNKDNKKEIL
jgi:hypothetical protein